MINAPLFGSFSMPLTLQMKAVECDDLQSRETKYQKRW